MATLQGKITDVTHKPPESLSSITVKAPSVRVGGGTDLIVSSPATVDFDRSTGDVTISGLTGGLSWLYLEGEGWSDSIALSVAEGMITLVEATANAAGAPGMVDYARLMSSLDDRVDGAAQNAADAAVDAVNSLLGEIPPRLDVIEEDLVSSLVIGGELDSGVWEIGPAHSVFPRWDGLVLFDDFRTPGGVVGAQTLSGSVWDGYGSWISDGETARAAGGSGLAVDAAMSDFTVEANLTITTSATGSAQSWRLYCGASTNLGTDGIWVGLNISNTGLASLNVYVTSGGASRQLVGYTGLVNIGITSNSIDSKSARFEVKISGQNVVINVAGKDGALNLSGELTPEEAAGLGTWLVVKSLDDATPGFALDEILVETSPYTLSEPVNLVAVDESGKISENVLPARLSEDALKQLIGTPQTTTTSGGLDELGAKIAFGGAGQHSIGVISDSSMNDSVDSLRIFDRKISELLPTSVRHVYHNWNTADAGWRHTTNIEGEIDPGHDGTVLVDTFSRVTSSLAGSTPDVGAAWGGSEGWASDGEFARASGISMLSADAEDRSMSVEIDMQVSLASAANQRVDFAFGLPSSYGYGGVMVTALIGATGALEFVPYVWEEKWTRAGDRLAGSSVGIPAGAAIAHSVSITVSIDIQNVSVIVKGPSSTIETTFQMTESQYVNSGSWIRIDAATEDTSAIALDKISVLTAPRGPQGDTLDVWNGAIAGAKLASFDDARIESMFGDKSIDILMVSMGHNHRTQRPVDFLDELGSWLDLWKQKHPETKHFIWISQNPQFPPAASVAAHRDRQHAVRLAHRSLGMDYVGGYEAISNQPDGGSALILADGIHPTTPPVGVIDGEYGAVKVAEAIMSAVEQRV